MGFIERLSKNQNRVLEGIFVSLIGGWCFSAFLRGIPRQIDTLNYDNFSSFPIVLAIFIACTAAFAVIYYLNSKMARITMFVIIYLFILFCSFNGYHIQWDTFLHNEIGNVCYQAVLCFVGVLAFLYVKKDIFTLLKSFHLSKKMVNIIVLIIGIALFAFVGTVTALRYLTYSSPTFDFGIFAQMYEYMRQKGTMQTTLERSYLVSHFAVHFSPIYYLGLPLYFVFPSPVTVQLIQAIMIALPLLPIVLLCRHFHFSRWITVGLSLLYALYPAVAAGSFYDIHENCFLTFGILMCVWALETKKNIMTAVFVVFTFLVKEDAALYILTLGVFYLLSQKNRKDKVRGLVLIVASLAYFAIAISIVKGFGLGLTESRWTNLYVDPQGGFFQIIQTLLTNPAYALSQIIADASSGGMAKLQYIMLMIIPIAGLLFATGKRYTRYILFAPFVLYNLLTVYVYMHDITFQYNFGVSALFMYVIILNLTQIKIKKAGTLMCVSVLCAGVMFTGSVFPKIGHYASLYNENKEMYQEMDMALATIPENASVSASGFLTAHLSRHLILWDQGYVNENENKESEYLAIDTRYGDDEEFDILLSSGIYQEIYKTDNIIIYHKK